MAKSGPEIMLLEISKVWISDFSEPLSWKNVTFLDVSVSCCAMFHNWINVELGMLYGILSMFLQAMNYSFIEVL